MQILTDKQLRDTLTGDTPLVEHVSLEPDIDSIDSQIQPASLDLTINEICLPLDKAQSEKNNEFHDRDVRRTKRHWLRVGECVRVFSKEVFKFVGSNSNHMALLFAPARLSRRGVFVMDIGVVDPGFEGNVSFTLINFGTHDFQLEEGFSVATAVIFKLEADAKHGLRARSGEQPYEGRYNAVRHLSSDFLGIISKATEAAKEEGQTLITAYEGRYVRNIVIPFVGSAVFGLIVGFFTAYGTLQSKAYDLIERVSKIESVLENGGDQPVSSKKAIANTAAEDPEADTAVDENGNPQEEPNEQSNETGDTN